MKCCNRKIIQPGEFDNRIRPNKLNPETIQGGAFKAVTIDRPCFVIPVTEPSGGLGDTLRAYPEEMPNTQEQTFPTMIDSKHLFLNMPGKWYLHNPSTVAVTVQIIEAIENVDYPSFKRDVVSLWTQTAVTIAALGVGLLLAANPRRKCVMFINNGSGSCKFGKDNTVAASANQFYYSAANTAVSMKENGTIPLYFGDVWGYSTGGVTMCIAEGT